MAAKDLAPATSSCGIIFLPTSIIASKPDLMSAAASFTVLLRFVGKVCILATILFCKAASHEDFDASLTVVDFIISGQDDLNSSCFITAFAAESQSLVCAVFSEQLSTVVSCFISDLGSHFPVSLSKVA